LGGAPITQQFANEIGADGYSQDEASAVDTALKLLN
jgi:5-methyltetrahydrofolate--homocysteine methyltransferase